MNSKIVCFATLMLFMLTNFNLDGQSKNYAFYKFKFDKNNPVHQKIMNEPTDEQLEQYSNMLEKSMLDFRIVNAIQESEFKVQNYYDNFKDQRYLSIDEFIAFNEYTQKEIKHLTKLSADIFDPVNGFAGGPVGTCLSSHPVMQFMSYIREVKSLLKAKVDDKIISQTIKTRNEPDGKLSANVNSMYNNSPFLICVDDVMNGDPDMPYDLTGDLVRFESVPNNVVPSYFTDPSNPLSNIGDLRDHLETNGIWGGVHADVFAFEGISTIFGTGTSAAELALILFCTDDIPAVNVWLGSSTSLFEKLVAHELTHSIAAVNHTNTQGDIDNNEIMRGGVNVNSNYWNVDFTINPFWNNVNLAPDCVNAIMLPITLLDFSVKAHFGTSHLSWTTVSETNNAYFTVERSGDGKDFYEIGVLPGAGNSTSERHYSFTDEQPTNGINYYRIRQIDFDGKYSYSHVESVRFSNSIADIEFISPNPVHRFSSITLDDQNDMSAVRIFNSQGMELSFRRESKNIYIDYVPGIYYLISYSGSKAIRFVVME